MAKDCTTPLGNDNVKTGEHTMEGIAYNIWSRLALKPTDPTVMSQYLVQFGASAFEAGQKI